MLKENMNEDDGGKTWEEYLADELVKEKRASYVKRTIVFGILALLCFFVVVRPYLNDALLKAVRRGDLIKVRQLIPFGANVNAVNKIGWTPLMHAVQDRSNFYLVKLLLDKGADVNAVVGEGPPRPGVVLQLFPGATPLMFAADYNSNSDILKLLIDKGAVVNAVARNGRTPLMQAARNNPNPDVLKLLIDKGAKIDAVDRDKKTPLIHAAESNIKPDVLRVLIEKGANVFMKDRGGRNALDYAEENKELKGTDAYNLLREKTLFQTERE